MTKIEIETIGEQLLLKELDDVVDVYYENDKKPVLIAKMENGTLLRIEILEQTHFVKEQAISR